VCGLKREFSGWFVIACLGPDGQRNFADLAKHNQRLRSNNQRTRILFNNICVRFIKKINWFVIACLGPDGHHQQGNFADLVKRN
jgi:hypothetical protein